MGIYPNPSANIFYIIAAPKGKRRESRTTCREEKRLWGNRAIPRKTENAGGCARTSRHVEAG